MPERPNLDPERRSETTDPANPPNSVLQPAARSSAVRTYVGGIAAVFLIVAAVFAYWSVTDRGGDSELDREPSTVGTAGSDNSAEESPGGFDPVPEHDSTRDELEFRGATETAEGPAGLSTAEPLTELGGMLEERPQDVAGRRIDVQDVDVESAEGNTFVIRDGEARASVIGSSTAVRPGQQVNVSGTVEPDGSGSSRIRATRVVVK